MYVTGHLAASALAAGGIARLRGIRFRFSTVLLPALVGGLTPDLIDKAILAMEGSRYGRTIGHSLVLLGAITLVWAVMRRLRSRWAGTVTGFWALGVATHLVGDLIDDALRGFIGGGQTFYTFFAWPFATPYKLVVVSPDPVGVWPWFMTPLEVVVLGGVLVWLGFSWTARRNRAVS